MTTSSRAPVRWWRYVVPDTFFMALLAAVAVGLLLPCRGETARYLSLLANGLIVLLFFGYGLRLAPSVVMAGLSDWRLQAAVLACTFGVFPLFGWLLYRAFPALLPEVLWTGVLFLCLLPSTVQSAVAFTSMYREPICAVTTPSGEPAPS